VTTRIPPNTRDAVETAIALPKTDHRAPWEALAAGAEGARVPTYDDLLAEVRRRQDAGELPTRPTREQVASWVYGQTALSNPNVTREHAERAAARWEARQAAKESGR
jgi:hypothetical protein